MGRAQRNPSTTRIVPDGVVGFASLNPPYARGSAYAASIRIGCAPSHNVILPSLGRSSSGEVMVMK